MTTNLNRVVRSRESTEQFLFSKTETKRAEEKPVAEPFSLSDKLLKLFPDTACGNSFLDAGMDQLASVFAFSAMAIKIDDIVRGIDRDLREDILLDTAKSIDACCKNSNGVWGQLDQNLFGCFFPEKNVISCLDIAKKIQKTVSTFRSETVSIGIAGYPTINYHKDQILENAQKALDHAMFFGPNSIVSFDSVSLNISGDKYYADGDAHSAVEEFKRALMIDPSSVNVHNSLGVCYGVLGDLEKALEEFETAAWLDAEEFMAIYNMGVVSLLKGEKEIAIERFLTADSLSENVFEIAFQTGRLYLEMNNPGEGKKYLEEAVRLEPDAGLAFRCLGDCYVVLDNIDKAIPAYKKAIKLNPNDAAALSALGCLYDLQGENPEISTTFCLQSVEISPENGLYRHRLGNLYLRQNRYEEALKEFETAKKLGHDSVHSIEEIQNRISGEASQGRA